MGCEAPLAWKCLFASTFFRSQIWSILLVRQTSFLACCLGLLIGLCVQDYKSPCVQQLRFIPPWLTSTHRQQFDQLIWKAQPAEVKKNFFTALIQEPSAFIVFVVYFSHLCFLCCSMLSLPLVGSGAVRIGPTPFPDTNGGRKRRTTSGCRLFC